MQYVRNCTLLLFKRIQLDFEPMHAYAERMVELNCNYATSRQHVATN